MVNEETLAALATLAKLAVAPGEQKTNDSELGFCDPPQYSKAIYVDDETGSFYFVDLDRPKTEQKQLIQRKAIRCKVLGIRLGEREYKGKVTPRIRVDLMADKPYMLEKKPNTNFAKGLMLALVEAGAALKETVTIEVNEPKEKREKTCFCNLYTSAGQVKISDAAREEYDGENIEYLQQLIDTINQNLKES